MAATTPNPFPLNIATKVDSWEKLQLLFNIDPTLKLTAEELNKIVAALDYIYNTSGNPDNFLGTYNTYALFIAAHPTGVRNQYAFVYEDENLVAGTYIYIWNEDTSSWEKETDTTPQGAVLMNIQGNPFTGLASLFFRFNSLQFNIQQIQGGGIGVSVNRFKARHLNLGTIAGATLTIDLDAAESFEAILTQANTQIVVANPQVKVVNLTLTGGTALTHITNSDVVGDAYDPLKKNKLTIDYVSATDVLTINTLRN